MFSNFYDGRVGSVLPDNPSAYTQTQRNNNVKIAKEKKEELKSLGKYKFYAILLYTEANQEFRDFVLKKISIINALSGNDCLLIVFESNVESLNALKKSWENKVDINSQDYMGYFEPIELNSEGVINIVKSLNIDILDVPGLVVFTSLFAQRHTFISARDIAVDKYTLFFETVFSAMQNSIGAKANGKRLQAFIDRWHSKAIKNHLIPTIHDKINATLNKIDTYIDTYKHTSKILMDILSPISDLVKKFKDSLK